MTERLCESKVHEERELSLEQHEIELERQLEAYEKQQQEVLGTARQVCSTFTATATTSRPHFSAICGKTLNPFVT